MNPEEIEYLIKSAITNLIEIGILPLESKIEDLKNEIRDLKFDNKYLKEEITRLKTEIRYVRSNTMPDSFLY